MHKIKITPEAPFSFQQNTAVAVSGSTSVRFDVDNLPSGSGHTSSIMDLGAAPETSRFAWHALVVPAPSTSAPIVGSAVEIYVLSADTQAIFTGFNPNVQLSTPSKRINYKPVGSVMYDGTNGGMQAAGELEIYGRYFSVIWWNNLITPLSTGNYFVLTPIPTEVQ